MDDEKQKSLAAREAYEAIAPVYDAFTAGSDFSLWLGHLLPKIEEQGLNGNRLLDVACGTGRSFIAMLERGWSVTACDISPAMIELAKEKARGSADLHVADMRALPNLGEFDLVWALDDAINYLLSRKELEQTLEGMRRNLADDGLIVFDVNTIQVYRTFFADRIEVEDEGGRLVWDGNGSSDFQIGGEATATFCEIPSNKSRKEMIPTHVHRQRHFPLPSVLEALSAAKLECRAVFGHEDDAVPEQPLHEGRHTKAVYIVGGL